MHLHSATEDWVTVCNKVYFVAHSLCCTQSLLHTVTQSSVAEYWQLIPIFITHSFKPYSALLVIILRTTQKRKSLHASAQVLHQQKGYRKGLTGGGRWRVTCTWWLLGLAVKVPWLEPVGPILALTVRIQDFSSKFSGLDDIDFWVLNKK